MKPKTKKDPESVVREIKRNTRRKFKPDEKIRIILEGLKGEDSISEICRREGIYPSVYYKWSKAFLEAGKKRLKGDTVRKLPVMMCRVFVRKTISSNNWLLN